MSGGKRGRAWRTARGCLWAWLLGCAVACGDDDRAPGDGGGGDGARDAAVDSAAPPDSGTEDAGPVTMDSTLRTPAGALRGQQQGKTRRFLGIPYAKPPVGALRFMPPQPAEPWSDERDASKFGPSCAQAMGSLSPAGGAFSEDCLTLNVFTPEAPPVGGLPVFVFIHGGAFTSGGSSQYDGQKLSEAGPLVVVTLNYRLGPFGFFSHPALDATRAAAPSGNDGLRDQQLALRWVKDNIAAFGGDPGKVTLAGESAGAMSTCLQLVSPESRELSAQFVLQSGSCLGGLTLLEKGAADALGSAMGDELCAGQPDVLACLRTKTPAELSNWRKDAGLTGAGFGPLVNAADPFLPRRPAQLIASGDYNKGALLLGTNLQEWGLFELIDPKPDVGSVAALNAAIDAQFAANAAAVKQQYAAASDGVANQSFVRLMTDAVFRCPTRALARLASSQGSKVFLYSFELLPAFHAFEIPYVFGNPSPALLTPTVDPRALATVQGRWVQFALTGDPNGRAEPAWPAYSLANDAHLVLTTEATASSGLAKADCDFWAAQLAGQASP